MQALFDLAQEIEFEVEYAGLASRDGECRCDLRRIRLRAGMSERLTRWTLGHELGHAIKDHRLPALGQPDSRQEREADEWAALYFIDLDRYREIEQLRGGHVPSMAKDFGIVSRGILTFQSLLTRIGDTVYLRPHHGAGQWLDRRRA